MPKVLSAKVMDDNAMVVALIKQDGVWDGDLVRSSFDDREAVLILSIPLCGRRYVDRYIWARCSYGVYTVKNVYWLAKEIRLITQRNGFGAGGSCLT